MSSKKAQIRLARESDARSLLDIYDPIVRYTAISFEREVPSERQMTERIVTNLERFPWLVLEREGWLWGYAYASSFRPREAYQWITEVTVYVHPQVHRRRVGESLYTSLLACLRLQGYVTALAVIALPNPASVGLHEKLGFRSVGVLKAAGFKHGRWHDVGWWQRALCELPAAPPPPRPLPLVLRDPAWTEALAAGTALLVGKRDAP